jgi:molecular chaperone DnaJ
MMATTRRDYYEILGVERSAGEAEIKRAFRRLAREHHPDVSDAPDGEAQFREVVEAYEVLSKSETRALYDRFGHAGLRSGGFRPTPFDFASLADIFSAFFGDDVFGVATGARRARGADIAAELEIELEEAASGVRREVPFQVALVCEECGGDGVEPGKTAATCPTCGGSGRIQHVSRTAFGEFIRSQTCGRCGGAGRIVEHPCHGCGGSGRVVEERELEVEIPPGIHDGQRIRLSGEGHAGLLGGHAGDLYVLVRIKPHPRLVREGDDVYSTVDLTMTQAALGARISAPTLEGEVELDFAPGTQPGEIRVLRGRGMPVLQGFGRGDQRVLVNVAVPLQLDEEQRRLLEEFERRANEETYRADESFFDKLKSAFR